MQNVELIPLSQNIWVPSYIYVYGDMMAPSKCRPTCHVQFHIPSVIDDTGGSSDGAPRDTSQGRAIFLLVWQSVGVLRAREIFQQGVIAPGIACKGDVSQGRGISCCMHLVGDKLCTKEEWPTGGV
jgi:hypothetical protein